MARTRARIAFTSHRAMSRAMRDAWTTLVTATRARKDD
jgi:hypothetical protein